MNEHECPRKGCRKQVPDAMFSCYDDWTSLPREVRVWIGRTAKLSILSHDRRRAFEAARRAWGDLPPVSKAGEPSKGWPGWRTGANRQVGATQFALLSAAAERESRQLMLDPARQNREWCAMKRMVRRGLFERLEFGNEVLGTTVIYEITDAGLRKLKQLREDAS